MFLILDEEVELILHVQNEDQNADALEIIMMKLTNESSLINIS